MVQLVERRKSDFERNKNTPAYTMSIAILDMPSFSDNMNVWHQLCVQHTNLSVIYTKLDFGIKQDPEEC
jgi:hypothetical protein